MKHRGKTPPFRGPGGEPLPRSVAEIRYLRLGSVAQWVMIRGEDLANPVLVLLHGGPGFPEMRLLRHFNAALEKGFTVVYWEQRGTDKSFHRGLSTSSMTVQQLIDDLDQLVESTRQHLGKEKVALYGHSWGSALGLLYVSRYPGKVSAYVGAAQVGDWPASEASSYAFTVSEARRRNHRRALRELLAIGPPPHTGKQVRVQRKWLVRFAGIARKLSVFDFLRITLGGPESSLLDLPGIWRGLVFSECMWPEVSSLNLVKAVPAVGVPVFFFLGRHDHVVDPKTSAAYFDALRAPSKSLVWFEESGHQPAVDEPAKFNAAMLERVRPAAIA